MSKKQIRLAEHEYIVAAVPEMCAGPGWANAIVWVYIHNRATGTFRCEDIQPDERTPELRVLWGVAERVHAGLMAAIAPMVKKAKRHG